MHFLRATCALVLLGILVAGLWPFHSPRNEVSWLSNNTGLLFGKYGSIVSAAPFKAHTSQPDGSCSIEIWLQPRRVKASGTGVFAFYSPESRAGYPFALRQSLGDLVLLRAGTTTRRAMARESDFTSTVFLAISSPFLSRSARCRRVQRFMWMGR